MNRPTARSQPNPFTPFTIPPPRSRTMSVQRDRDGLGMSSITEPVQMRATRSTPSLGDGAREGMAGDLDREQEGREVESGDLPPIPRVTINPPHPPWDDNSLPDQPYENPYYTLPIKYALWLPINPIGSLDLDMTVTMSVALTSEPGAGHVGPLNESLRSSGSVLSGLTADLEPSISISGDEMPTKGAPLDRTEDIDISPTTGSRVQNVRSGGDVSTTNQQSDLLQTTRTRPRMSGNATGQSRHLEADLLTASTTQLPLAASPPNSPSVLQATNSIGQNSPLPPPTGIGSRFAQRSMISQVPTQSVAIQKALNEETEVLQRSHIQLQEEAEKQNTPRSRWTSWAFKKRG